MRSNMFELLLQREALILMSTCNHYQQLTRMGSISGSVISIGILVLLRWLRIFSRFRWLELGLNESSL